MADQELPFFTRTAVLETYMKKDSSASPPEAVELIARSLRSKPDLYTYFFSNRPHSSWAKALAKHAYFIYAPEPVKSGDGYRLPLWLEQEYLINVANEAPEIVVFHVKSIEGHSFYRNRAIKALQKVPPEMIGEVLPVIISWLKSDNPADQSFLETFVLIKILAENKSESALSLFEIVTTPRPHPKNQPDSYFSHAAITTFPMDEHSNREYLTLSKIVAILQDLNADKTIAVLETQLCNALRLENKPSDAEGYKDNSFWRNAIGESGQDSRDEYKDKLLILLRDTLESLGNANPQNLDSILKRYLNDPHEILRRLGLYLLSQFPDRFHKMIASELLNLKNMDDLGIHHEYFTLLEKGYIHLAQTEKEQLVNTIVIGLSPEKWEQIANWKEGSEKERREYADIRKQVWIRDRLWMLREYLEGEIKGILDDLVSKFGEPTNPTFTHWTSQVYAVSDVSPVTTYELAQKSNDELLEYLRNWKPSKDNFGPERESYAALGEQLADLIFSDLERYQPIVNEIASMHSGFATTLINARIPEDCNVQTGLDLILDVCESLLRDEQIRLSMEDLPTGTWISLRYSAVALFEKLLAEIDTDIPQSQWLRIRDLLILLTEDPDPNLEDDRPGEEWFGHNDPLTVSINHVRSEAVLSLIFWASRFGTVEHSDSVGAITRRLDSKLNEVFTKKVKRENDFSLAVHSVFGRELNRLYWMDKIWVEDNLNQIFPSDDDEDSIAFYVAAWDSYVLHHQINMELFDLLRPQYEKAIDNVSKGYLSKIFNPVEGLSHHLLLEYQLAKYEINSLEGQNSLIAKFFNKCLPEQRGDAVWALSQRTKTRKEEWQRARELWAWRLEAAANGNFSNEFKSEMAGFSHLLLMAPESETITTLWAFLEGFLPYLENEEGWSRFWHNLEEYLAKEVERNSVEVIRFYNLMHDQINRPTHYYDKNARKIIEYGARRKESQHDTLMLIDKLCQRGNYMFRNIQEQILSSQ